MPEDLVCPKCQEAVTHGAKRCQSCGYARRAGRMSDRFMYRMLLLGKYLFYITIIGIPLARWYAKQAEHRRERLDRGVGMPAGS